MYVNPSFEELIGVLKYEEDYLIISYKYKLSKLVHVDVYLSSVTKIILKLLIILLLI
jgi:hypothetical protein